MPRGEARPHRVYTPGSAYHLRYRAHIKTRGNVRCKAYHLRYRNMESRPCRGGSGRAADSTTSGDMGRHRGWAAVAPSTGLGPADPSLAAGAAAGCGRTVLVAAAAALAAFAA